MLRFLEHSGWKIQQTCLFSTLITKKNKRIKFKTLAETTRVKENKATKVTYIHYNIVRLIQVQIIQVLIVYMI